MQGIKFAVDEQADSGRLIINDGNKSDFMRNCAD